MTPAQDATAVPLAPAIRGKRAWTAATLAPRDWILPLTDRVARELETVVAELRARPREVLGLRPADFALPATARLMARAKAMLERGSGLALLDRLPAGRWDKAELRAAYWLLSQLLGRPVPQYLAGTLLHDVQDTGRRMDGRVRGDLTNQEINWHTDNGFSEPPVLFGLATLRGARSGGESRVVSLMTAYNRLKRRAPRLLARLHQDFCWNRMGEHPPDQTPWSRHPVYAVERGRLRCRLNRRVIEAGHAMAGIPLDPLGRDAVEALYAVLDEPGMAHGFTLAPGQFLWVDNGAVAHHRTAFVDHDEPDRRRHLIRLYLRDHGAPTYLG